MADAEQQTEIDQLRSFNKRVSKLERSSYARRWVDQELEVRIQFDGPLKFEKIGDFEFKLAGKISSSVPDFDEDEINAFVLTYRILTQRNDRLSIARLAEVYQRDWMPEEARNKFEEAREHVNNYLDSAATIEFGDHMITIREIVDIVIYGGLAHSNVKKEKIFDAWIESPGISGLIWVEFMAAMNKSLLVCSFLKRLNEAVIENYEFAANPE